MGATITCGKKAAILRHTDGQHSLVLFEESYESNTLPHNPRWSAIYIGGLAGAIRRIYLAAASCDSGMLRSRRGEIRSESYIEKWMEAIRNPMEVDAGSVWFSRLYQSRFGENESEQETALRRLGEAEGVPDWLIAGILSGNDFKYALAAIPANVMEALFGVGGIYAGRAGLYPHHCTREATLPWPMPKIDRNKVAQAVDGFCEILQMPHSEYARRAGFTYCLARLGKDADRYAMMPSYWVMSHVIRAAGDMEAAVPGSGLAAIRLAREAQEQGAPIPPDAEVVVSIQGLRETSIAEQRKAIAHIARVQGVADPDAPRDSIAAPASLVVRMLEEFATSYAASNKPQLMAAGVYMPAQPAATGFRLVA